MMKASAVVCSIAVSVLVTTGQVDAQRRSTDYASAHELVDAGGGAAQSPAFTNRGSLGQGIAGTSSSTAFAARHGALFVVLPPDQAAENLVVNGSFEDLDGTFVTGGNGVMSLPAGTTAISGWTVAATELIWAHNNNIFGPSTPYGSLFLDLTGLHDAAPFAEVRQTIATEPGQRYRLTCSLGTFDGADWFGPVEVEVTAVGNSERLSGRDWQSAWMDFTAAADATTITIRGTQAQENFAGTPVYLGLDNVSVVRLGAFDALFAEWRLRHFGNTNSPEGESGADWDRDGADNVAEMAFNLDPHIRDAYPLKAGAGTGGLPVLSEAMVGGESRLALELIRHKSVGRYTLNSSSDMIHWEPVEALVIGDPVPVGGDYERVTLADEAGLGGPGSPIRFLRIEVTYP